MELKWPNEFEKDKKCMVLAAHYPQLNENGFLNVRFLLSG